MTAAEVKQKSVRYDMKKENGKYIHDIKLEEKDGDKFAKQFNLCSELWAKSQDCNLSDDERKAFSDMFYQERMALETGNY